VNYSPFKKGAYSLPKDCVCSVGKPNVVIKQEKVVEANNAVVLDNDDDVHPMDMTAYSEAVSSCNKEPSGTKGKRRAFKCLFPRCSVTNQNQILVIIPSL
jgi:hypothetical protein